ncbi:MAG: DNA-binding protein [Mollicutes bacterium]|nr:DNA-binding protein [Mollicutes bacterium]
MGNLIYYSALYDYYHNLLTDTQKKYFVDYYFNNLSLQEIADNYEVSKNAISKTLIEVTNKLEELEQNLNLYHNHEKIKNILKDYPNIYEKIEEYI